MKMRLFQAGVLSAALAACASTDDLKKVDEKVSGLQARFEVADARSKTSAESLAAEVNNARKDLAAMGAQQDDLFRRLQVLEGRTDEVVQTSAGKINVTADRLTQIETTQLKLQETAAQLDMRIAAMEKVLTSGGIPARAASDPVNDDLLYKNAYDAHVAGEYTKAREGFTKLLRDAPESKLASNAEFWLGEGYLKVKAYDDALKHYTVVIEKYPTSTKACSSILKVGVTLEEMGEKQKAKTFYAEVGKKCPAEDSEAKEAARRLKR